MPIPLAPALAVALWLAVMPSPAASARVIDRTLVCTVTERAGVRVLELTVRAGGFAQHDPFTRKRSTAPASVSLWTGFGFAANETELVSTAAGTGSDGRVAIGKPCRSANRRVSLTSGGLPAGAASRLGDHYECITPARLLVRVRAAFAVQTSLRTGARSGSLLASGTVTKTEVAVRTIGGRPLVFASLFQSGAVRLFKAPSCVEDNN